MRCRIPGKVLLVEVIFENEDWEDGGAEMGVSGERGTVQK